MGNSCGAVRPGADRLSYPYRSGLCHANLSTNEEQLADLSREKFAYEARLLALLNHDNHREKADHD